MSPEGLGLFLASFGATLLLLLLTLYPSVPLIALSVAILLPGLVLMTLTFKPVPPRAVRLLMESSALQIEAILEEFKPSEKAVYVFRKEDGFAAALVPLSAPLGVDSLVKAVAEMPFRTLVETASGSCLQLLPPVAQIREIGGVEEGAELEAAITAVLTDVLELAEDVKVATSGNRLHLSYKPLVELDLPRFNECLGSLPTSVAACVVSAATGRSVKLVGESELNGKYFAVFELGDAV